jgi:hypothetical protein
MATLSWGQVGITTVRVPTIGAPTIGLVDFYGLHKVSESKVRQVLGAREGDPLPHSKGDTEEKLDAISGVVESHLEAVCCRDGKTILYVGIEERGAPHFEIRDEPDGEDKLPEEITSAYGRLIESLSDAARRGSTQEDLTAGQSRAADPSARAIQDMFPQLAKDHLADLRRVIHNSADEQQRATAVYVIAYAPKKSDVLDDLQYALKDFDAGVRTNATRALVAYAVSARLHPEQDLKVQATWFIEMLNSLSWSDRNRALLALQVLTDENDPLVLDQLRTRAMPALVEMARWKTLEHALPAYVLVGRVAGLSQEQIERSWERGERESVIAAAAKKKK